MPSFLNPWMAAIAAAIAVPALLILYFLKLRRRELPVSSTLLWKKAIQDLQVNAPFQKLRRNLLLLLQLLLLAFLCLALSRPVANYTPGAARLSVLLIDRSASMSTVEDFGGEKHTRLEEAKLKARSLVESMGRHDQAMLIAFDDSADVVQPLTNDAAALKTAIDGVQPTDRRSRLKLAYRLAEAQVKFYPEQLRPNEKPTVFVYSDGRIADAKDVSVQADVRYTKIGRDDTDNIAVVSLSAKRNYKRPTEVQVFARLANFGDKKHKVDVQLTIDGKIAGTATDLMLLPERWSDADFKKTPEQAKLQARDSIDFPKLDITTAAIVKLQQMHKDALPSDDATYVVVPPPKSLSVLLVTDANYFFEKVLKAVRVEHPDKMTPAEYETATPSTYDVIIFDRYTPKFLPASGNFIWFGGVPDNIKVKAMKEPDGKVSTFRETMVLDWKRDHPILRGLILNKLYVGEAIKVTAPIETETLVETFKGPLILLHREGRSTHLICTLDPMQSNWPLRLSFPIFMDNALRYLSLGTDMDVRESFAPGATPSIPRTALQKIADKLHHPDNDPNAAEFKIKGPTGEKIVKVPPTGDVALPALDKVGVYTTEPPIPSFEKIAVNLLDANESNTLPLADVPGGTTVATSSTGKSRLELWWWLVACAALPLLLIEWWVYTRRVHL